MTDDKMSLPKEAVKKSEDVLKNMTKAMAREANPNVKDVNSSAMKIANNLYNAVVTPSYQKMLQNKYTELQKNDPKTADAELDKFQATIKSYADTVFTLENAKRDKEAKPERIKELESMKAKFEADKQPGVKIYNDLKKQADDAIEKLKNPKKDPGLGQNELLRPNLALAAVKGEPKLSI